jgi:hypothetical protein
MQLTWKDTIQISIEILLLLRSELVIKAVQIFLISAFSFVPMNDLILSNCLMSRKKISTCHLLFQSSQILLGIQLNWFVISSITCLFSSSQTDTRLNLPGYLLLDDFGGRWNMNTFIPGKWRNWIIRKSNKIHWIL